MRIDSSSPLLYVVAFIAIVACATFKRTGRAPTGEKRAAPVQSVRAPHAPDRVRAPAEAQAPVPAAQAPAVADGRGGRVILVTVDGWHAKLTERMPVWEEMSAAGTWTLAAIVPLGTTTAISHAALYTGAEPKVNGVTGEPPKGGEGDPNVHGTGYRWRPLKVRETLLTAARKHGYQAVAAVQKGKLVGLLHPDGSEAGIQVSGDKLLVKVACDAVRDAANRLVILHFKMTDDAGHRHGWLSEQQYAEAAKIDAHLRAIRACIDDAHRHGGLPTTLIVTSDHGGNPGTTNHGGNTDGSRQVPWVAVGPGIAAGHEIRTGVRLLDTAPTVLRLLGIPASAMPRLAGVEVKEAFRP